MSERCVICGKPLEKRKSIARGMGDVCAARLGLFTRKTRVKDTPLLPSYSYRIIKIAAHDVGLVIDNGTGRSVTNSTDAICDEINVNFIIYRDTVGNWDMYDNAKGFLTLALHGTPTVNMDTAVEVAKIRYFNDLGGLFTDSQ